MEPRRVACLSERRQVIRAGAIWNSIRHVNQSLCRLPNRDIGNHLVAHRIDRYRRLAVLQSNVDPRPITGWPNTVRKTSYWNCGDQFRRRAPPKCFHLVRSADRDIGELAVAVVYEVHMISDWTCIHDRFLRERRLGIKYLHFAYVL